jgi:hypothetical protein
MSACRRRRNLTIANQGILVKRKRKKLRTKNATIVTKMMMASKQASKQTHSITTITMIVIMVRRTGMAFKVLCTIPR